MEIASYIAVVHGLVIVDNFKCSIQDLNTIVDLLL